MSDSTKTLNIFRIFDDEQLLDVQIKYTPQMNLLELLNKHGVKINQECGANGTCTTCRVFVLRSSEKLPQYTEIEKERADERGFSAQERLSCQLEISGDVDILIK